MPRDGRPYRPEQYPALLTADPPICRVGPALAVLRRCELIRRGEPCWCRFAAADLADELIEADAPELAEYFMTSLEPEDVDELTEKMIHLDRTRGSGPEITESPTALTRRLRRLVEAGAGLTDRYSDDLDD